MVLEPGGILVWLLVGGITGWLAGTFMKSGGYTVTHTIVLGVLGAFGGGFLASLVGFQGQVGLWGTVFVALIGALTLIVVIRALPVRSHV